MKRLLLTLAVGFVAVVGFTFSGTGTSDAQFDVGSGELDWEGWTLEFEVGGDFDGLSLSDVRYDGTLILNKASLPVMNVFYDNDVCGPFADQLGGRLEPVSWANNATIVAREFTQNGERWAELGIQDRIGDYLIYQVWYLSPDGIIDAHIFSRGLQCDIRHDHLPFWRFDFDIAGPENDQILRRTAAGMSVLRTEFGVAATAAVNHDWQVRDSVTGDSVSIDFDDGSWNVPDPVRPQEAYAQNKVYGRTYQSSEDRGWAGRPTRTLDLYDNDENIDNADVVLWYSGYLPHTPEEGPALWHSTGVRMTVNPGDNPPPPPPPPPVPDPGCSIRVEGSQATVSWNDVGATRYSVRRSGRFVGSSRSTFYRDVAPPGGSTYQLVFWWNGNRTVNRCVGSIPPPDGPVDCSVTARLGTATLSWNDVGASRYSVRRNRRFVVAVPAGSTSYADLAAPAGATYEVVYWLAGRRLSAACIPN